MEESIKIFCDESNFTGPDLLNDSQPIFTYATVCIGEDEADSILHEFLSNVSPQKTRKEVKSSIFTSSRGKIAGLKLIEKLKKNIKVSIVDKQYALACKFVETIIEPTIQDINIFMYQTGMHLHAAELVYAMHIQGDNILRSFLDSVRNNKTETFIDANKRHQLFGEYITHNKTIITEEMSLLTCDKWSLDLTLSSLHVLLTKWYLEKRKPLEIIYDPSKPISDNIDIMKSNFKRGNHNPSIFKLMGKEITLTYDMFSMVEQESKESAGIMLADLVAGFLKIGEEVYESDFDKHIIAPGSFNNANNTEVAQSFLDAQLFSFLTEPIQEIIRNPLDWLEHAYFYAASQHDLEDVKKLRAWHIENLRSYKSN